ncbi:MAG: NlpC/P60 family protein [Oscillospiraceae bacterium]
MRNRFLKTTILTLLLASVLVSPALADTIGGGTVKADGGLNLRTGASTSSPINVVIPNGSFLLIEEKQGDWYKAVYNGAAGYVHASYVDFAQTMNGTYSAVGKVTGSDVRFRAGASASAAILGSVNTGDKLTVIGVSGEWLRVKNAVGTEGYVHSQYVDCATGYVPALGTSSVGEQVVATAKQYLGYPYVWGGMSPSGFDCSGFVNYVYKLYGYSMNRVAQDIYSNDGTWVDKSSLQPGDLVFFGWSAYSVSHVGMYIGDGQFIHASSSSTGVIISSLSETYYTNRYVGAKRIIG